MNKWMRSALLTLLIFSTLCSASTIVTYRGMPVKVTQSRINIGDRVQSFQLITPDFEHASIGSAQGHWQVIATLLNLKHPVDQREAVRLEELSRQLPNTQIYIVSRNLPMELKAFAQKHNLKKVKLLSDFQNNEFSQTFGTMLLGSELRHLNARAVFLINPQGKLVYKQRVKEIDSQPNYRALKQAFEK